MQLIRSIYIHIKTQGCDFSNSCCYASWVRLAGSGGYMLSARSMRNIEYLCPGSVRFLGVDGCT